MKCQKCQKREANEHIVKTVNGKKQEMYLCSECAAETPFAQEVKASMDFGIGDFLGGFLGGSKAKSLTSERVSRTDVCPVCNMSFQEFLQKGRLGCGECYSVFKEGLARPLRQIHGTCSHMGKVPSRMGGSIKVDRQIAAMEKELSSAVLKQNFERAAELRDKIKELKDAQN